MNEKKLTRVFSRWKIRPLSAAVTTMFVGSSVYLFIIQEGFTVSDSIYPLFVFSPFIVLGLIIIAAKNPTK